MSDSGPKQVDDPEYHSRNHTAAQTCGWTASALRGEGRCYKNRFYGIQSHRCIQMTPVVKCNERCVFCWRDHAGHAYELDEVAWDDPEAVVDASLDLQRTLLSGFGGNDQVPRGVFEEAMEPRHVAISLGTWSFPPNPERSVRWRSIEASTTASGSSHATSSSS